MSAFLTKSVKGKCGQELPDYYRLNGAIYICRLKNLREERSFFIEKNIYSLEMDRESSVDIDEEFDFFLAQCVMEKRGA